jgi:hypothetical protein
MYRHPCPSPVGVMIFGLSSVGVAVATGSSVSSIVPVRSKSVSSTPAAVVAAGNSSDTSVLVGPAMGVG